jgi:copper oxidase (laccase) domain-containing protein
VAERFSAIFPEWGEIETARRTLNLPEATTRQMRSAGIRQARIFDCELCTTCQPAQFFSYRREPENPGRMVASICRLA